jgi:peptidoglycan/xylan/chitin deacetylase (PgdA/CDA1 family)
MIAPALGAALAGWSLPALAPVAPPLCDALRIDRRLATGGHDVALTFDDGPHPQGTPAVLDILDHAGARATFFLVGEQVERCPELAAEVARRGHAVGVHGHRHRNLLRIPPRSLAADLDRAWALIAETTGSAPQLYRPPYGIFSAGALLAVRRRGWVPLLWSRWGRDWARRATPASIATRVTRDLAPGDVVLLHDADTYSAPGSWRRTASALPRILDELDHRGLRPITP